MIKTSHSWSLFSGGVNIYKGGWYIPNYVNAYQYLALANGNYLARIQLAYSFNKSKATNQLRDI